MNENTITSGRIVSLSILLKDQHGEVLADNRQGPPQVYRHGAGMILPQLERYLTGMQVDDEAEFSIPCERAFGIHEPGLVLSIAREDLETPDSIRPGDEIRIFDGTEGLVTFMSDKGILLDANHPLAGKDLYYHVRVIDIREANDADEPPIPFEGGYGYCEIGCGC
jgi:FKBP-type peptidyl-prolyl cis-trans isomerase SlyD